MKPSAKMPLDQSVGAATGLVARFFWGAAVLLSIVVPVGCGFYQSWFAGIELFGLENMLNEIVVWQPDHGRVVSECHVLSFWILSEYSAILIVAFPIVYFLIGIRQEDDVEYRRSTWVWVLRKMLLADAVLVLLLLFLMVLPQSPDSHKGIQVFYLAYMIFGAIVFVSVRGIIAAFYIARSEPERS